MRHRHRYTWIKAKSSPVLASLTKALRPLKGQVRGVPQWNQDITECYLRGVVEAPPVVPRGTRTVYTYDAALSKDADPETEKHLFHKTLTAFGQLPLEPLAARRPY